MVQVTASLAMKETDPYLETFQRFEAQAKQPAWVFPLRKAGIARFAELGFPTLQQEDWRFTNVAPIAKLPFKPVLEVSRNSLTREALAEFTFGKLAASRLVSSKVTSSDGSPATTWSFVRINPSARTMNPEPTPVSGTAYGLNVETLLAVMVTTDGFTAAATRTIASDSVRLIGWAPAGWPLAVPASAGSRASVAKTYVPAAESRADSSAAARMSRATGRRPPVGGEAGAPAPVVQPSTAATEPPELSGSVPLIASLP